MQHILRLGTMEVKNESTHEITDFLELFNETLSNIKGRDYKFNARAIMFNENSATYCPIQMVFGLDFVISKVVSCQMHYTNNVNRVSFRISASYRDLFKSICCYVRQCWPIYTILLELSRSMVSCILLFILGALQYTMLIFGLLNFHSLRQYEGIM